MANDSYKMQEERVLLYEFPRPTPETLTKEYLEKLIVELKLQGNDDPEIAHRLERRATECFLVNIIESKYSVEEELVITQLLLDIGKSPFPRWFS